MPTQIGNLIFYTVEEVAEKFKVSPATIYSYIKSGKLAAKQFGRRFQIPFSAIEKYWAEV